MLFLPSTVLLLLNFLVSVNGCLNVFPNNTDKTYHVHSCDGSSPHFLLSNHHFDDSTPYPLPILHPLTIYASLHNMGPIVRHILVDFQISSWENSYDDKEKDKCHWEKTDTYGMVSNLDGCEMTRCPIASGNTQHFRITFDIGYIVAFLEDKKLYNIKVELKSADTNPRHFRRQNTHLACFTIQSIFTTE